MRFTAAGNPPEAPGAVSKVDRELSEEYDVLGASAQTGHASEEE